MRLRTDTVLLPEDTADQFDVPAAGELAAETASDRSDSAEEPTSPRIAPKPRSSLRGAVVAVVGIVLVLGGLTGWLGWQVKSLHDRAARDALFVQVARQTAENLTTIDWEHAEADVHRITDSATGAFYDDFSNRSKPFIEVVQKVKSKSTGTVTAAGLESASRDEARVLVAVSVRTSTAADPQEQLRGWRLRVTVSATGGEVKVSNVEFVA